jgi:hypothetical protein
MTAEEQQISGRSDGAAPPHGAPRSRQRSRTRSAGPAQRGGQPGGRRRTARTPRQAEGTEQRAKSGGRRRARNAQRGRGRKQRSGPGFWGDPTKLPSAPLEVRIAQDPAAVPQSLGPPPLPGHEVIAQHYFGVVYDRAVTLAFARTAGGGLIQPHQLADESDH